MQNDLGSQGHLSNQQLQFLRKVTDEVAAYLREQTSALLEALRPALAPARTFGQYIEHPGNRPAPNADKLWSRFVETYRKVARQLPGVSPEIKPPLPPIDAMVELYSWEHAHPTLGTDGLPITVVSPTTWVLNYRSGYSLSDLRQSLMTRTTAQSKPLPQFVATALLIGDVLRSVPRINDLLAAMRLTLEFQSLPELPALSFATLKSWVTSFVPPDDVVLLTTRLSGVPRFLELIDPESITRLNDPLRAKLEAIVSATKPE